ncbi:L-type lectin-domain containing receptor kinase IV.2-like [Dorcoceras hygrometricum]|uniref:L-type lectin-domain containing receptor kinase IV.2-like n=1 Tax=Dorcoceras hygrometricum TaxID=472368 RepID=A0A2Z7CYY4_9LAMI|nr:L-type lectin-domain containing receptor kinase IV.2-like [Dorcoceras hygrometricum]
MLAENTTREVESDTVAVQELKTVKRDFGGLNKGIWPKSSLDHQTKFSELCSLDRSGGSSTVSCQNMQVGSDVRKDGSAGATEPAGGGQIRPAAEIFAKGEYGLAGALRRRWTSWSNKLSPLEQ